MLERRVRSSLQGRSRRKGLLLRRGPDLHDRQRLLRGLRVRRRLQKHLLQQRNLLDHGRDGPLHHRRRLRRHGRELLPRAGKQVRALRQFVPLRPQIIGRQRGRCRRPNVRPPSVRGVRGRGHVRLQVFVRSCSRHVRLLQEEFRLCGPGRQLFALQRQQILSSMRQNLPAATPVIGRVFPSFGLIFPVSTLFYRFRFPSFGACVI